jgi:hypothetical protein
MCFGWCGVSHVVRKMHLLLFVCCAGMLHVGVLLDAGTAEKHHVAGAVL